MIILIILYSDILLGNAMKLFYRYKMEKESITLELVLILIIFI